MFASGKVAPHRKQVYTREQLLRIRKTIPPERRFVFFHRPHGSIPVANSAPSVPVVRRAPKPTAAAPGGIPLPRGMRELIEQERQRAADVKKDYSKALVEAQQASNSPMKRPSSDMLYAAAAAAGGASRQLFPEAPVDPRLSVGAPPFVPHTSSKPLSATAEPFVPKAPPKEAAPQGEEPKPEEVVGEQEEGDEEVEEDEEPDNANEAPSDDAPRLKFKTRGRGHNKGLVATYEVPSSTMQQMQEAYCGGAEDAEWWAEYCDWWQAAWEAYGDAIWSWLEPPEWMEGPRMVVRRDTRDKLRNRGRLSKRRNKKKRLQRKREERKAQVAAQAPEGPKGGQPATSPECPAEEAAQPANSEAKPTTKPPKPKVPVDAETMKRRISHREWQVRIGRDTLGYKVYQRYLERSLPLPAGDVQPPPAKQNCSKRGWDGQLRKWRTELHKYDAFAENVFTKEELEAMQRKPKPAEGDKTPPKEKSNEDAAEPPPS